MKLFEAGNDLLLQRVPLVTYDPAPVHHHIANGGPAERKDGQRQQIVSGVPGDRHVIQIHGEEVRRRTCRRSAGGTPSARAPWTVAQSKSRQASVCSPIWSRMVRCCRSSRKWYSSSRASSSGSICAWLSDPSAMRMPCSHDLVGDDHAIPEVALGRGTRANGYVGPGKQLDLIRVDMDRMHRGEVGSK